MATTSQITALKTWALPAGLIVCHGLIALVGVWLKLDPAVVALGYLIVIAITARVIPLAISLALIGFPALLLGFVNVEPHYTLAIHAAEDIWLMAAFIPAAVIITVLIEGLTRSRRQPTREEQLNQASREAYLAEVQALTQTGTIAWNIQTGALEWSAETYRICGVDPDSALSANSILQLIHPDEKASYQLAVQAAIKARSRFDHELRIVRSDGDVRTLHMVGHFLPEKPEQFIGALTDITQRRQNEQALLDSEFRYRNIFRAMAVSFWELDFSQVGLMLRGVRKSGVTDLVGYLAANHDFVRDMMRATRVIDVNDYAVMLQGRGDKGEMLGNIEPFWPEASTPVYAASVIAAITGKPGFSAETRMRKLDGSEFDALFTASFPSEGVANAKLLIGVIDISERVAAQETLRRVQAEFAHAARLSTLGELAASIAHEVNQPLAAIATNASAGLRWLDRPEPNLEEVRALATRISADARRAADIITRIRGMAVRGTAEHAPLSLASVIEEAAAFLRHDMQAQRVSLQLALPADLPPVLGDRTQLQQVVVNLAMNAAQAIAQSTGPRRVVVSASHENGRVTVNVDDTGPGIPPDHLDRLFQSFFTTKEGGMGIGLPICRSIVESHGGAINAENREGGGARFRFTLPAHQVPSA